MEEGTFKSLGYSADTDPTAAAAAAAAAGAAAAAAAATAEHYAYYDIYQWDTREDCEVRQILDRIADKWSLLVMALLDEGCSLRFTELRKKIDGISQRMLTVTLRQLERDGLVRRTVQPVVPPRVDYELTPLGVDLHETVYSLVAWTEAHRAKIAEARSAYDLRAAQQ
jgi:DNA-binding HxlR family transcriptional regulator